MQQNYENQPETAELSLSVGRPDEAVVQTEPLMQRLRRVLRHLWMDERDAHAAVPPALSDRLRDQVATSESGHSGQIRICVESALPLSYLWRYMRQGESMQQLCRQRALMMFARLRVWDTEHNNGVLVYLQLAERNIELVADRALARTIPPERFADMTQQLSLDLCREGFACGLEGVVAAVDQELRRHFPRLPDAAGSYPNELPDAPVLR